MKRNVGGLERTIRVVGGISALTVALLRPRGSRGRATAIGIGAAKLITGLTGYCPLNQLLGRNTRKARTWLPRGMPVPA